MRTAQQILADLRHTTEWSQPNVRYNEFIALIDELEAVLVNVKNTIEKSETDKIGGERYLNKTRIIN